MVSEIAEKSKQETVDGKEKSRIETSFGGSIIKCECGTEILMLPDLKETSRAIENHVSEHRNREKDFEKARAEEERVRDGLITQVLRKAGESTRHPF